MRPFALATTALLAATTASACRSAPEQKPAPAASISASAPPSPAASAEPPAHPPRATPLTSVPFEVTTSDGVVLEGSLARSPDPGVPVVLFVHHWAGSREEWKPLLDRLARVSPAPHLAAIDLRGHGASTRHAEGAAKGKATPIAWHLMSNKEAETVAKDVPAVLAAIDKALGAPAKAFVLVGDDFGATAAVLAAAREPRVSALALVAPGAALHGIDVYRPFAASRERALLLAASNGDPVSADPVNALGAMAKEAVVKRYAGEAHTAEQIAEAHPELWDDLEEFLLGPAMEAMPPAREAKEDAKAPAAAASSGANVERAHEPAPKPVR